MIRKIFFLVLLVFTIIWFTVAYTLKNNVINLIKNSESDNIKISYNNIKIAGYPFHWKILILEPKVKLIDHINSREFFNKNIILTLDYSSKKASINFGTEIKEASNHGDKTVEYLLQSVEDIKGVGKLNKPLYRVDKNDTLKSVIKSLQLNNKAILVFNENKEIFNIKDFAFFINKKNLQENENIFLRLNINYDSENNLLNFNNASLDIAASLKFTQNDKEMGHLKDLAIERFIFSCDNNSKVDLKGELQFFANRLPHGKLFFDLENYNNIVDKLLPSNIAFSKKIIKFVIAKAVSKISDEVLAEDKEHISDNIERAKFDIEFSDKGINIGSINLLEFKFEENKEE